MVRIILWGRFLGYNSSTMKQSSCGPTLQPDGRSCSIEHCTIPILFTCFSYLYFSFHQVVKCKLKSLCSLVGGWVYCQPAQIFSEEGKEFLGYRSTLDDDKDKVHKWRRIQYEGRVVMISRKYRGRGSLYIYDHAHHDDIGKAHNSRGRYQI